MTIRVYCYMGSEYAFNFREQLITVIGLLRIGTHCPNSLALLCTAVVVLGVRRIERAALVARCWIRPHHISTDDLQAPLVALRTIFLSRHVKQLSSSQQLSSSAPHGRLCANLWRAELNQAVT